MSKLSILIPAYNMREYINQCLASIRRTVRIPYEVIIIDDGSQEDECVSIIEGEDDVRVLSLKQHYGISHALNMGIDAAEGAVILFLHADIMLAPNTVDDLLDVLIENPQIGAVSAVAPREHKYTRSFPGVNYHDWVGFVSAAEYIRTQKMQLHPEIYAELFCLMVRRDVVEAVGGLDEDYQTPPMAAFDYTARMTRKGYQIASVSTVYVHHQESVHVQDMGSYVQRIQEERELFREKLGLSLDYSFFARIDILELMDLTPEGLRVLDIGCACGATLREIGMHNPTAKLYGVELNEKAAAFAAPFAKILTMDVEHMDLEVIPERFDYIVMGDVIEHLLDPWAAIANMHELLVPGGCIVASIPNVAFVGNIMSVLLGNWTYQDAGLLDRTHLRFFTYTEIVKIFEEVGFKIEQKKMNQIELPDYVKVFREELLTLQTVQINPQDLDAYQWRICARKQ